MINKKPHTNKSKLIKTKGKFRPLVVPVFVLLSINLAMSITLNIDTYNASTIIDTTNNQLTASSYILETELPSSMDLLNTAYDNLLNSDNVTMTSIGKMKSAVNQDIYIKRMYDGKTHFLQNINNGIKSNAMQVSYTAPNDVIMIKGTNIRNDSAQWNGKVSTMTLDEFTQKYVIPPTSYLPYKINAVTITNIGSVTQTQNGDYTFSVSLHPTLATGDYAKSIQNIARLKSLPTFKSLKLNITVDEDYNFKTIQVKENYSIRWLGINMNCNTDIETNFDFATKATIPAIT